jgi:hypothetical protein
LKGEVDLLEGLFIHLYIPASKLNFFLIPFLEEEDFSFLPPLQGEARWGWVT